MRKTKFHATVTIGLALTIGMMAAACATNLGVYSPDTPQDQLCDLKIDLKMGITGIDGKPVSWGIARQAKSTTISIPAGEHSLRFEYFYKDENIQQSASNFVFTYDFVPGHSYTIRAAMGGMFTKALRVYVTDRTDRKLSKDIPLTN